MSGSVPIGGSDPAAGSIPDPERLRRASRQLEGVFVEQLFKAMRSTVPEGGVADGGAGEEMFTAMMDQHTAEQATAHWERGLGEALYRQLRAAISGPPGEPFETEGR